MAKIKLIRIAAQSSRLRPHRDRACLRRVVLAGLCLLVACSSAPAAEPCEAPTPFPRPPELEPDIAFWKLIYTGVDTRHGLIHDNRDLGVIYELIPVPDHEPAKVRADRVRRAKEKYRTILLELADGKSENLSPEETIVRDLWKERGATPEELRKASKRLRFQLGQSDRFRDGWVRSGRWRAYIEQVLATHGVPTELAALPHVESSFHPGVSSSVGAVGLWQFTRSTGRRYMRVDHVVDERLDPYASTVAAARLLKYNHGLTGTWPLAITAYNHGASGMRRASSQLGGTDIVPILREYRGRAFGFASRNFYVAFLAALEADREAAERYAPVQAEAPEGTTVVEVPAYVPAAAVSTALNIPEEDLRSWNPALRNMVWRGDKFIPEGFALRVDCDSACGDLGAAMDSIPPRNRYAVQVPDKTHKVRRGQTLSQIASAHGFTTAELLEVNTLRNRHHIRAGQVLRLPVSEPRPMPVALERVAVQAEANGGGRTHRVRRGESLSVISGRYLVPSRELMSLNGLSDPDRIYVGQVLKISADRASGPLAVHRVRKGDSLSIIAERNGVARADVMAWNGITDPNRIFVGQKLRLAPPPGQDTDGDGSGRPAAGADATGEAEIARVEIQSGDETGILGPALPEEMHPDLSADPADYSVSADGTIEVQAAETLGHYADWLGVGTQALRTLNGMRFGNPVPVGSRVKLDFSRTGREAFEERRRGFHLAIQTEFFRHHRILGTKEHTLRAGESLWLLTVREYRIPVWLLRQYNPDLKLNSFRAGTTVRFPVVETKERVNAPVDCREDKRPAKAACAA